MVMDMKMMGTWCLVWGWGIIQFCCASQLLGVSLVACGRESTTGVKSNNLDTERRRKTRFCNTYLAIVVLT